MVITYRGAIVGFGGIAEVHAKAYENIKEIQIVAASDVTPERLQVAKKLLGFDAEHLYSDYKEMMANEKLDFVDICVPYKYHKQIAVSASENGLNVLCEKPLASSLAEIDEMIAAAKKNNVKLVVCHNWSYLPFFQKAKEVIDSKILDRPYYIEYSLAKEGIIWRGSAKEYLPEWRTRIEFGGGPILEECPHLEYLSKWLLGSEVKSVKATIDNLNHENSTVEDFGIILNRYGNGAVSVFRLNYFSSESKMNVSIQGENALISLPSPLSRTYVTDPIFYVSKSSIKEIEIPRRKPSNFSEDLTFSMESLFRDFVVTIEGGRTKHPIGADDGKQAVEAVLAAYESAALDSEFSLPIRTGDPVYAKGVLGLRDLKVSKESSLFQKNLFLVRGEASR